MLLNFSLKIITKEHENIFGYVHQILFLLVSFSSVYGQVNGTGVILRAESSSVSIKPKVSKLKSDVITESRFECDSTLEEETLVYEVEYDSLERMILERFHEQDQSRRYKSIYKYEKGGTQVIRIDYATATDVLGEEISTHDSAGRLTSTEYSSFPRTLVSKTIIVYKDNLEIENYIYHPQKKDTSRWTFGYNNNNLLTEKHYFADGRNIYSYILEYDTLNRLSTETKYVVEKIENRTTYSYDSNGNVMEILRSDSSNNPYSMETYKYDSVSNITERITEDVQGGFRVRYICNYDEHGMPLEEKYFQSPSVKDGIIVYCESVAIKKHELVYY